MRKETHISTHKEEYKKGGEENRKHLENDPHTKKKKVKRSGRPILLGVYLSKSNKESSLFSLYNLPKLGRLSLVGLTSFLFPFPSQSNSYSTIFSPLFSHLFSTHQLFTPTKHTLIMLSSKAVNTKKILNFKINK